MKVISAEFFFTNFLQIKNNTDFRIAIKKTFSIFAVRNKNKFYISNNTINYDRSSCKRRRKH